MENIKLRRKGLRIRKKNNSLSKDRNQILKRLEIIKSSISIEDEEVIELQVMKLQKLDIDDEIKTIVTHLEAMNYAKAIKDIESYIARYIGVVEYVDSEAQGLKLELKSLESKLQELVEQKTEYINNIEEFNREYNFHLGELIKDILNLKREILYKQTIKQQKEKEKYQENIQTYEDTKETLDKLKATITELEEALDSIDEEDESYEELTNAYNELKEEFEKLEEELKLQEEELEKTKEFIEDEMIEQEYEEVNSHYEEFESEYEHIKESFENSLALNDEEKKELKALYKKAARLCHPDIVPDELKEKAHELMQKLNEAYGKNDIPKVKEILHSLQNGTSFEVSSETIEDKELLKVKIKDYKENISHITSEIEEIKEDETYQTIAKLDDWDEYFEELQSNLESEKEKLIKELRDGLKENIDSIIDIKTNEHDIPDWMQKLWDWADKNSVAEYRLPRTRKNLLELEIIDFTSLDLKYIPQEICNLKNATSLLFQDNDIAYLPNEIIEFKNIKKINLNRNTNLCLTIYQNMWIQELKANKKAISIGEYKVISQYIVNEYFEKIETDLKEKKRESSHVSKISEEEPPSWIQKLWDWADEHNIPNGKLSRKKENLLNTKILDFTNIKLSYFPKEIVNLENLQELILWGCDLKYLPRDIIKLTKLKKLNLRGNLELAASPSQLQWIDDLSKKSIVFKDSVRTIREETVDMFAEPFIEKKSDKAQPKQTSMLWHEEDSLFVDEDPWIVEDEKKTKKQKSSSPTTKSKKEVDTYKKDISSIENPSFEKIRRYCNNLVTDKKADEMHKQLAEKGKMYKALIYSSLGVFIEKLNGETITLIDWGCGQGIGSMLVLDYIKEKQLDIKVSDVILIDDDTKTLNRAIAQVEALAQDTMKFTAIKSDDNNISDTIKSNKNNIVVNIFANDKIPVDLLDIDYDIFGDSYFLCVSNGNKELVDEVYENTSNLIDVQDVSIRDGKIGRFQKFERIFAIDNNEIPF